MKYIVLSLWLIVLQISCVGASERSRIPTYMTDPLIGLEYEPKSVVFDRFPRAVKWESGAPGIGDGINWVFSVCVDADHLGDEYWIVAGLSRSWLDTEPPSRGDYEETAGTVLVKRAGRYRVLGSYGKLYKMLGLSEKIVGCLLRDAVERMVRAYGGKGALEAAWGRSTGVISVEPALARAFEDAGVHLAGMTTGEKGSGRAVR